MNFDEKEKPEWEKCLYTSRHFPVASILRPSDLCYQTYCNCRVLAFDVLGISYPRVTLDFWIALCSITAFSHVLHGFCVGALFPVRKRHRVLVGWQPSITETVLRFAKLASERTAAQISRCPSDSCCQVVPVPFEQLVEEIVKVPRPSISGCCYCTAGPLGQNTLCLTPPSLQVRVSHTFPL